MLLEGKVALVTGAARGIGAVVARAFCREGAAVVLNDVDAAALRRETAALAGEGFAASAQPFDVRDRAGVPLGVREIVARHGRIDVLVNNAGVYPRRAFLEMSDAEWDRVVDVNLNGTYNCCRAVAPQLVTQAGGAIVNVGSVTFFLGLPNLAHYIAAKGGVVGLTRALARELGPHGVRVNCITPGAVLTETEKDFIAPDEAMARALAVQCLKRRILPEDIARVAVFLASDLAAGMTGQTLNVDGGWVMY